MSEYAMRKRAQSGNLRTLIGLIIFAVGFFAWLDWREVRHDELSSVRCEQLNRFWREEVLHSFALSAELEIDTFDCPSENSGLARGLDFIHKANLTLLHNPEPLDYWRWLKGIAPALGNRPRLQFAGSADYAENKINLNPSISMRGDPVEVAGVIIHEARHLEEGRNTHVPCAGDGRLTCDKRLVEDPATAGAYSHNVLFYFAVAQQSDVSSQLQRSARRLLNSTLESRFNFISPELRAKYSQ